MPLAIWVPPSERPKFYCRLCKQPEYTAEALASHVARHFRDEEARIREMSPKERAPGLTGDHNVDVEFEQWHAEKGDARNG